MTTKMRLRALVIAVVAVLSLATPVSADTCCANVPVKLDPTAAQPGDTVRLVGMECRNADNSGPLPLNLGSFWLATTNRPAEVDPDTTPGEGLPDMPPVEEWLAFDSVAVGDAGVAAPGDATITVPDLPDGKYQLWWWCDNDSGPGGGIHYSTGPRLAVGNVPDTATEAAIPRRSTDGPVWPVALLSAIGFAVLAWSLRHPYAAARRVVNASQGSDR